MCGDNYPEGKFTLKNKGAELGAELGKGNSVMVLNHSWGTIEKLTKEAKFRFCPMCLQA